MKQNETSIRFILFKSRRNKENLCPVFCRITHNGKRSQFSTGLFVEQVKWNPSKQKSFNSSEHINSKLEFIKNKLENIILRYRLENKPYDASDVIDKFRGKTAKEDKYLLDYLNEFLVRKEKLIGIDIKQITFNKFKYVFKHVNDFVNEFLNKDDILLNKLDQGFLSDFEYFLKVKKKNKQITINKSIQRFREPIKHAVLEGFIDKDPFAFHKPKSVRKEVVFLSETELNILETFDIKQTRLQYVRDMFVFCCYTGLAYSEMSMLEKSNIQTGFDKKLWITMTRKKTQKEISIPLLSKAEKLIDKYWDDEVDLLMPKISNQKFNSYLKEIAYIVGISKKLTHHVARKTFATTVLLYNNVPIEIVSELLGHSSIKTTQDFYGKVLKQNVSREMCKLMEKLEN